MHWRERLFGPDDGAKAPPKDPERARREAVDELAQIIAEAAKVVLGSCPDAPWAGLLMKGNEAQSAAGRRFKVHARRTVHRDSVAEDAAALAEDFMAILEGAAAFDPPDAHMALNSTVLVGVMASAEQQGRLSDVDRYWSTVMWWREHLSDKTPTYTGSDGWRLR